MIKVTKAKYVVGEETTVTVRPLINNGDVASNRLELSVFEKNGTTETLFNLQTNAYAVRFFFINEQGQYMSEYASTILSNVASVMIPQGILGVTGKIYVEIELIKDGVVVNATGLQLQIDASKRILPTSFPPTNFTVHWEDIIGVPNGLGSGSGGGSGIEGLVNVKDYGAVGDGVTDDSQAIRDAIADLPIKGGTLYFPHGVYLHGDGIVNPTTGTGNSYPEDPNNPMRPLMSSNVALGRDIRFVFDDYEGLTITGYGATILSHPNNGECMHNSMFELNMCRDVVVQGLTLNGQSHVRQPELNDYENGQGWNNRNNISVYGGDNITLKDITSLYSMMDGFGIGGMEEDQITNLTLINCKSDYAYRNGLTLSTCRDVLIRECTFTNTGQVYGIAPKIGVDIEADWGGTFNENIYIEDCYFEANVIAGLAFAVGARNCHVNRCTFNGEFQHPVFSFDEERWGYNYVRDCHFINTGLATNTQACYVEGNTFELFPVAGAGQSVQASFFHFQGADPHPEAFTFIRNNTFRVDLSGVSATASSIDVGRMWFGQRKRIIFTGNTLINLFSGGSSGVFVINWSDWATNPEADFSDNVFVFTETRLESLMNTGLIASDYDADGRTNYFRDNRVIGYPKAVTPFLQRPDTRSFMTGGNYYKSEMLWNNTLYKFNPKELINTTGVVQTNLKVSVYINNRRIEAEYIGGWYETWRIVAYENGRPTLTIPTDIVFYQNDDNFYMNVLTSRASAKVEVNLSGSNGYVRMFDGINIFNQLSGTTEISGLTALKFTFQGKSITAKTDTANHLVDVGHNAYITGLNKSGWWNGTAWVDASGVAL